MIYKAKGDNAKALSDMSQAIQRDPRPADLYFERAALRKAKGETDQVLADLNDGLTRQPDNMAGLLARAQIKQAKGDAAAAIADYDAILAQPIMHAYFQRGQAREKVSQRDARSPITTALARSAHVRCAQALA